jgi:hypothetical protein
MVVAEARQLLRILEVPAIRQLDICVLAGKRQVVTGRRTCRPLGGSVASRVRLGEALTTLVDLKRL